jgi:4-hydroxy-2-oxoheptanedioate aldolase
MTETTKLMEHFGASRAVFGCWLEMFSPIAAEIVAQAGYDCVLIDLEHGPGSVLDAVSLMHAIQGRRCTPLMRVAANDPVIIKRALDVGIEGIMIPGVNTPAEAEAAVAACRYAPRGIRGAAMTIVRAADYGLRWQDYARTADQALLVMCQIESGMAVENVAAIAATDGVDLLFVGPFDLSASTGHLGEPDHPEVRAMIADVEAAAKAGGKRLGGIPTPGRPAAELFAAGYDLVLADADAALLRDGARDGVAALMAAAGRVG